MKTINKEEYEKLIKETVEFTFYEQYRKKGYKTVDFKEHWPPKKVNYYEMLYKQKLAQEKDQIAMKFNIFLN